MVLDISALGRRSFMSQNALSEVLTKVRESGEVPSHTSKSTVKRRKEEACAVETPYGSLIQSFQAEMTDGSKLELPFCHPAAILHHVSNVSSRVQHLLTKVAESHSNSLAHPWTLALYFDEVSPGNQLKINNKRKLWAIYFSVMQFGGYELSQEDCWFVLTVVRSETVTQMKGGLSHLFLQCVKLFSLPNGNLETRISLRLLHGTEMLCFRIGMYLADESAIKLSQENKGASGKMLCLFCQTTIQARYAPANLGNLVPHHEHDLSKLCLHSDTSVWQIVDHLDSRFGIGTKKAFSELEVRLGFNYVPGGVLLDRSMREKWKPISMTCFDPMHVYLVAGVFQREMTLLLPLLSAQRVKEADLHSWCTSFTFLHIHRSSGATAKDVFRKKFEGDFKATASEVLAVYPLLRARFQTINRETMGHDLKMGIDSFYRLCDVLDSLKHAATGSITPLLLREKIEAHLVAFKVPCCKFKSELYKSLFSSSMCGLFFMCNTWSYTRAELPSSHLDVVCEASYGVDSYLPKHHYSVHLPLQLERFSQLPTCFVHERRHKLLKRCLYHCRFIMDLVHCWFCSPFVCFFQ